MYISTVYTYLEIGGPSAEGAVVELILADKETRGSKYYQVFWVLHAYSLANNNIMFQVLWLGRPDMHTTWEPASSLPAEAIEEYENGLITMTTQETSNNYGRHTCRFLVTKNAESSDRAKKPHIERPLAQESGGWALNAEVR